MQRVVITPPQPARREVVTPPEPVQRVPVQVITPPPRQAAVIFTPEPLARVYVITPPFQSHDHAAALSYVPAGVDVDDVGVSPYGIMIELDNISAAADVHDVDMDTRAAHSVRHDDLIAAVDVEKNDLMCTVPALSHRSIRVAGVEDGDGVGAALAAHFLRESDDDDDDDSSHDSDFNSMGTVPTDTDSDDSVLRASDNDSGSDHEDGAASPLIAARAQPDQPGISPASPASPAQKSPEINVRGGAGAASASDSDADLQRVPFPGVATLQYLYGACTVEDMIAHLHNVPAGEFVDNFAATIGEDRPGMAGNCGPALSSQPRVLTGLNATRDLRIRPFATSGGGCNKLAKESAIVTLGADAVQRGGLAIMNYVVYDTYYRAYDRRSLRLHLLCYCCMQVK